MCNTMLPAQKAQRLHRGNILLTMPSTHGWHGRRKFHKWHNYRPRCPRETRTYVSAKKRSQKHRKSPQTWKTQKQSWTTQKHPWTKQKSHDWPKHHDDHIEASDDEYVYVKEEVADEPSREHVKQKVMAQSSSSRPDPPRPSAKLASRKQSMVKVEQPEQPEKKPLPLMISPERPQSVGVNVGIWPPRPVMRRPPDGELKMATVSEGCE